MWRAASAVAPLTENSTWSQGDYNHSLYMVKNDQVTHYEVSTLPYYTPEGDTAARNSNIEVNSTTTFSDDRAIDWWMGAPFHAMGMMDPRLTQTGYGAYREVKSGWQAGFTLDVLRGNPFTGGTFPVYFPGDGSSVPLTSYSGNEWPDPLQACPGYSTPVGLPVFVEVGGNVSTTVGAHSFTGNGVALAHCAIDSNNPSVGSSLKYRGGVIVIPQQPLVPGVTYVVALTVNGTPYTWAFSVNGSGAITFGPPAGWSSVGGIVSSEAAASTWGASRTDVFVRGGDNALWHRSFDGSNWAGWESLGGTFFSDPAAVSWGPNRIDVFVRGADNALWHRAYGGTSWSGWESLGGVFYGQADAASWGPNHLDVFVRGADNALWKRTWDGTSWRWQSLGGVITADPGAVSSTANSIDVFVRGSDNALWHDSWNGSSWSWSSLGGTLPDGGPAPASCSAGHLDVFVLGADTAIWQRSFNGSTWSFWQRLGGFWTTDPGAVCPAGTTTVRLFEVARDGSVVTSTLAGS